MKPTDIEPRLNSLLLEAVVADNKTSSGIIISGGSSDTPHAKIVALGVQEENTYNVGDVVFLDWTKTNKILLDGLPYFFIKNENIFGKVK